MTRQVGQRLFFPSPGLELVTNNERGGLLTAEKSRLVQDAVGLGVGRFGVRDRDQLFGCRLSLDAGDGTQRGQVGSSLDVLRGLEGVVQVIQQKGRAQGQQQADGRGQQDRHALVGADRYGEGWLLHHADGVDAALDKAEQRGVVGLVVGELLLQCADLRLGIGDLAGAKHAGQLPLQFLDARFGAVDVGLELRNCLVTNAWRSRCSCSGALGLCSMSCRANS